MRVSEFTSMRPAPRPAIGGVAAGIALAIGIALSAAGAPGRADITGLETTETPVTTAKQSRTIQLINYLIDQSHYRQQPLDDAFSEIVLHNYLDRLDPGRNIFVRDDIEQFEKLHHRFDDMIREGGLKPVFAIFSIYRIRVDQRVEYALARLDEPFDFGLHEAYRFDREDAPWAGDTAELNELWRKRIKNDILNLRLSGKEDADTVDTLRRRYTHLARRVRQFNSEDVFQVFINAYINAIDPHTTYFSPRAGENFKIQMRLSLEGIGAVLQTDNEYTQVRRVIPGGPADLARALEADDRITGVAQGDGEIVDVIGWRLDDVVELIRGPKGSVVRLEVLPGGDPDKRAKVVSIRRDKINLEEQAAKKRILEIETAQGKSSIGVIDLPSFYIDFNGQQKKLPDYRSTTRDVRKLLEEFQAEGIDGLVIDLRGNGGGALTEAITLTGLFIRKGPVVQVRKSNGKVDVDRDPDPRIVYDGPLAVLVDRHSASASEIFAGAIQDYRRGLIIGEPTFGKGTVQHLVNLNRFTKEEGDLGQLKVTIAQFFRINGDSTQHRGVIPDIIWPGADEADEAGERAYENVIPWRQIEAAGFEYFQDDPGAVVFEQIRNLHTQRVRTDPEFQYFSEARKLNAETRKQKFVTLNETERKHEREWRDKQRLALENRRRRARGEEAAASVEALDRENEAHSKAAETSRDTPEPDAYLRESGGILNDYLYALGLEPGAARVGAVAGQGQAERDGLSNN